MRFNVKYIYFGKKYQTEVESPSDSDDVIGYNLLGKISRNIEIVETEEVSNFEQETKGNDLFQHLMDVFDGKA